MFIIAWHDLSSIPAAVWAYDVSEGCFNHTVEGEPYTKFAFREEADAVFLAYKKRWIDRAKYAEKDNEYDIFLDDIKVMEWDVPI